MKSNDKLWTKNFILLMVTNTLFFISFNIINPILPMYVTSQGISIASAGIVSGAFSLTALVFRPISGVIADVTNTKRLFVAAGVLVSVTCMGYVFAEGYQLILLVRILHGAAFAINTTVSLIFLTAVIPKERLGEGIGYYGIGPIIAISVAPGLGIELGSAFGYEYCFYIAGVMALLATICIATIPNEKRNRQNDKALTDIEGNLYTSIHFEESDAGVAKNNRLDIRSFVAVEVVVLAVIAGLFSFANSIEFTFMALYAQSRGIEGISAYFVVSAAFVLLARLNAGRIYDKRGLSAVLYASLGIAAVGMFILGSATCLLAFLLAAAFKAFGQGAGQPSLQAECLKSVTPKRIGLASSTYYLGPDLMQGIGPIVGGLIIDRAGYNFMYYTCSLLLLAGMGLYWVYAKRKGIAKVSE